MTKKERLLRAVGLILIIRDELEEIDAHNEWVQSANKYLEELADGGDELNQQFEQLFKYLDAGIQTVDEPVNVINELICILRRDLRRLNVNRPIASATENLELKSYDTSKVKLLDSKLTL